MLLVPVVSLTISDRVLLQEVRILSWWPVLGVAYLVLLRLGGRHEHRMSPPYHWCAHRLEYRYRRLLGLNISSFVDCGLKLRLVASATARLCGLSELFVEWSDQWKDCQWELSWLNVEQFRTTRVCLSRLRRFRRLTSSNFMSCGVAACNIGTFPIFNSFSNLDVSPSLYEIHSTSLLGKQVVVCIMVIFQVVRNVQLASHLGRKGHSQFRKNKWIRFQRENSTRNCFAPPACLPTAKQPGIRDCRSKFCCPVLPTYIFGV